MVGVGLNIFSLFFVFILEWSPHFTNFLGALIWGERFWERGGEGNFILKQSHRVLG